MAGWLSRRDDGQALRGRVFEPVLVTHEDPDFDSMVSCWLVQRLIGDGGPPIEVPAFIVSFQLCFTNIIHHEYNQAGPAGGAPCVFPSWTGPKRPPG